MDKPKPNKLAQFYSGQIQPNGALSLRRSVQFWSGVDIKVNYVFCLSSRNDFSSNIINNYWTIKKLNIWF